MFSYLTIIMATRLPIGYFCRMETVFELGDIGETATMLWKRFPEARVFAFHGEMGAGKTSLIHAMCDAKKVVDAVSSPTFSIINEYRFTENGTEHTIFHIDLYRLNSEEEATRAGVEDCLYSGHYCLVEWPEKAPSLFPEDTVHIRIEPVDDLKRRLKINGN